jgi:hypothetical protein
MERGDQERHRADESRTDFDCGAHRQQLQRRALRGVHGYIYYVNLFRKIKALPAIASCERVRVRNRRKMPCSHHHYLAAQIRLALNQAPWNAAIEEQVLLVNDRTRQWATLQAEGTRWVPAPACSVLPSMTRGRLLVQNTRALPESTTRRALDRNT